MSSEGGLRARGHWSWLALALVVAGAALAVWGGSGLGRARHVEIPVAAPSAPSPHADGGTAAAPHATGGGALDDLVRQLEARLQRNPDDADGWAMLGRTQAVGGQHQRAVLAFKRAVALRAGDAVLLADYADALAMTQGTRIAGEPAELVRRALALAPDQPKALSLAGTEAFERQDWAAAVRHWERLQAVVGADNVFARQIASGLAQARERLGKQRP